jgi:hypothetical protein
VIALAVVIPAANAAAAVTVMGSPNPGTGNLIGGLVAFSPVDIWAVGSTSSPSYAGCHGRTLTARSNGTAAFVEVPAPATPICAAVNGVAGRSTSDIWAVGSAGNGRDTHLRHWDGAAWSQVPGATIPVPPSGGRGQRTTGLNAVTAISANDVWAVGRAQFSDFVRRALIEHYDGTTWTLVTGPQDTGGALNGISALGSSDAWAVGAASGRTLTTHWNGKAWTTVPSPNPNTLSTLRGVSMVSGTNVWAVGDATKSTTDGVSVSRTVIEHGNGSSWSVVPSPNVGAGNNVLTGIAARSANDILAVGYYDDVNGSIPIRHTLWLHWNGTAWSVVPSPNLGTGDNWLLGVVAPADTGSAWAYGVSAAGTLIQRFDP